MKELTLVSPDLESTIFAAVSMFQVFYSSNKRVASKRLLGFTPVQAAPDEGVIRDNGTYDAVGT